VASSASWRFEKVSGHVQGRIKIITTRMVQSHPFGVMSFPAYGLPCGPQPGKHMKRSLVFQLMYGGTLLCEVAAELKGFGGSGFYDYDEAGKRTALWSGLRDAFKSGSGEVPFEDLNERMLFAEAQRSSASTRAY
jgi:hypothetical protein